MKLYPALDVDSSSDLLFAFLDDFSPAAIDERGETTRVFFFSDDSRDAAGEALREAGYPSRPIDVSDEDWARRSQENLGPITVGRITVAAPWHDLAPRYPGTWHPGTSAPRHDDIVIVIVPSMGFGTGHHETTRLCLQALQEHDVAGASVLDVGTGSGVLAIAADRLGAATVLGIDSDPDAIQSASENLALNPQATRTAFEARDAASGTLAPADVIAANLTGAVLVRMADRLMETTVAGGRLILSGILAEERQEVRRAFTALERLWEQRDGDWVGLVLKKR